MTMQITITINDIDEKILHNDLADFEQWLKDAVEGKTDSCWKRMRQEWTTKLMDDTSFTGSIPGVKEEFIAMVTSRSDYKNRAERDVQNILP
jgi:hypothetical protein